MFKSFVSAVLTIAMAVVALACIGASGFASWQFWHAMAADPVNKYLMSSAALSLDAMKALLPLALAWGLANRRLWHFQAGFILFICLVGFSFATAIGYISTQRSGATAGITSLNSQLQQVVRDAANLETRISRYQGFASADTITADLAAMRTNRRWTSSSACTDATATASRKFCAEYLTGQGKLAAAISIESDRKKLDILRDDEKRMREAGAGREANPQASTVAKLIPKISSAKDVTTADAEFFIRVTFAGLIEVCASLGLFFAFNHGGMPTRAPAKAAAAKPREPEPEVVVMEPAPVATETQISQISDFRKFHLLIPDDSPPKRDEHGRIILESA